MQKFGFHPEIRIRTNIRAVVVFFERSGISNDKFAYFADTCVAPASNVRNTYTGRYVIIYDMSATLFSRGSDNLTRMQSEEIR